MKMIASRKNRMENGIRAVLFGSNPHSKGDDFSRSLLDRAPKTQAAIRIIDGSAKEINEDTDRRFIN